MVELPNIEGFPVDEVMARLAIWTQTALVKVLVTGNAGGRQAKKRSVQIFILDRRPFLRGNVRGIMALVAFQTRVFAFQHISGLFMIERLGVPFDEREILPVMFRVATGAFLA